MEEYLRGLYSHCSYKWSNVYKLEHKNKIYKQVLCDDTNPLHDLYESYLLTVTGKTDYDYRNQYLNLTELDTYKDILPYISFIQDRFGILTRQIPKGLYYDGQSNIWLRVALNSKNSESIIVSVPKELFILMRAFKHIQKYKKVPKYLIKYIEEVLASELLEG